MLDKVVEGVEETPAGERKQSIPSDAGLFKGK